MTKWNKNNNILNKKFIVLLRRLLLLYLSHNSFITDIKERVSDIYICLFLCIFQIVF